MRKLKSILWVLISYLFVFAVTVVIAGMIMNQGKVIGNVQKSTSSLPLVYVQAGGRYINEMHGYTMEMDGGYLRDTLTPMGESKTINLAVSDSETRIVRAWYELYNDRYDSLVETGSCPAFTRADAMMCTQITIVENLKSNREYCLRVLLVDEDDRQIEYHTRVRFGDNLQVAEKMKFVLDFNEATFDKNSKETLEDYLEVTGVESGSDYNQVNITSSSSMVTWGGMSPYRISDVAVYLKEINTETAAFTLKYQVESKVDDRVSDFLINEYYRIRLSDEKVYLLDFERSMEEIVTAEGSKIEEGAFRLGIGDGTMILSGEYGTEDNSYCYFENDRGVWFYDLNNKILTNVYEKSDNGHGCVFSGDTGIKVVQADDETGDLHFLVYGYMHDGNYEGSQGIMVYRYNQEQVLLEEMIFIPSNKGFKQIEQDVENLSYMNEEGEMYLLVGSKVYKLNVALGRMEDVYSDMDSDGCRVSTTGKLVITEGASRSEVVGKSLRIIDLNKDEEMTISAGEHQYIRCYGFSGDNLVYGMIDENHYGVGSDGILRGPAGEIHIVDGNLKDIRTFSRIGNVVLDVSITDDNLNITLGKPNRSSGFMDFDYAGQAHIMRNAAKTDENIAVTRKKDGSRGIQNYVALGATGTFVPITQKARRMDPGYDIAKSADEDGHEVRSQFYVYTRGELYAIYETLNEAIDFGNAGIYGATVVASDKTVLWQRAGRAYIWDLGIEKIDKAQFTPGMNKAMARLIAEYEGFDIEETSWNQPFTIVMEDVLPVKVIDLTGLELSDVLHFVYRDRIVAVKMSETKYGLIVGYNELNDYISVADPETGTVEYMGWNTAKAMFEEAGNVYYSYED